VNTESQNHAGRNSPYEIRLIIEPTGDAYKARWIEPDMQESESFDLALPLQPDHIAELRWYLETYVEFPGTGDRTRAAKVEDQLKTWGRRLFDTVFGASEGNQVYNNLIQAVRKDKRHALITLGSTDPQFLSQPWEMMRDKRGPLTFQDITIRRQLKGSRPTVHHKLALPLRILLIVSRPSDVGFIDPRNSIAPMLDALDELGPGLVELDFCDPPTMPELERKISAARRSQEPYHVVHFDGHGTYLPKTGVGALCFEDDDRTNKLITARQLGDLMARLDISLVILEACRGADLSDKPVFGSLAPALLEGGVGSVLAFSHSVHIKAARILVERFYQELAAGLTVGQALDESRAALHADNARWLHSGPNPATVDLQDWFIPQLYQIGADPALTELTGAAPQVDTQAARTKALKTVTDNMHGFPPPPMYRFHGRALEMLELERAFRRHPAVLLSGMGGMGKTALAREAAAWQLRTGRFEKAVFCSFEQGGGAERVVQVLGQALEGEAFSSLSEEAQWQKAVELFHSRKILLVWDNFESTLPVFQEDHTTEQPIPLFSDDTRNQLTKLYRDLTENKPTGRILVTCRPAKTNLRAIREMTLAGLKRPDGLHLLAAILDIKGISTDRKGCDRHEIDRLVDGLQYHPLSIELIAPHLKNLTPQEILQDFAKLIEKFENADAFEQRNSSLLASLEFSKKHLSGPAQKALPYLAWFQGGVFEQFFLAFSELDPDVWSAIRGELTATALLNVEDDINIADRPYLRFHPTLPYAAKPGDVSDPDASEKRFIDVYQDVSQLAYDALHSSQPGIGKAFVQHEEANLRCAISRSYARAHRLEGCKMADTLRLYLKRAGRRRELNALLAWQRIQTPDDQLLDLPACDTIRRQACTLMDQGLADEAIEMVKALIERLRKEGLASEQQLTWQLAVTRGYLGRIYYSTGAPAQAIEPLKKAIAGFEGLGDKHRANLSTALGDLANACSDIGQFHTALEAAERALTIARELGRSREVAAGLARTGQILEKQYRYQEAQERYAQALPLARDSGDIELQAGLLHSRGILEARSANYDRAIEFSKEACALSQEAGDLAGEMRAINLIGVSEQERGQWDAAEAWYQRSRDLAEKLNDRPQLAAVCQNVGVLYRKRAEHTEDTAQRGTLLAKALGSVKNSLNITLDMNNEVDAAACYVQLAILHRMLEDLDEAQANALKALEIRERLGHPDVYIVHNNLAEIARATGDARAAAKWQAKYDAKIEELKRLRRGGRPEGQAAESQKLVEFILALAQAAYSARTAQAPLPPEAAEALAQLSDAPAPLSAVAPFLQAVADGKDLPPIPPALPPIIAQILQKLTDELK
jgi:hypothetical protein